MAVTGVMRPGFIQLRVMDMEAAIRHYRDMLGLDLVTTGDDGRVYFKAHDEFDHHSVILRPDDNPGMDCMGFKVTDDATLADFETKLKDYGLDVSEVPVGEQIGLGRRVRFKAPTGHNIDLYSDMERSENGPPIDQPDIYVEPPRGMGAIRFDHALIYGRDIDAMERVFVEVLGFRRAEFVHAPGNPEETIAIFLTCSTKAHDIALVRHDEDDKLHHASFLVEDWNAIGHAADLMARYDIPVDIGPTRHGITRGKTIYFWDPSGNRNEVFAGGYDVYPDHPVRHWSAENVGKAIFYYEKELNDTFLAVVT